MALSNKTWERIKALGILLLGVAAMLSVWATILVADIAIRIEESSECRFDRNAEISTVNDLIDLETAIGLKALVEDDEVALRKSLDNIERLNDQFRRLIEGRDEIVEDCKQ